MGKMKYTELKKILLSDKNISHVLVNQSRKQIIIEPVLNVNFFKVSDVLSNFIYNKNIFKIGDRKFKISECEDYHTKIYEIRLKEIA